jgi:hypothetical protein
MIAREETPAEGRVRDAVGALPPARADGGYRDRLRREFVAGELAPRLRVVRSPWRWRVAVWSATAAAAAAAFVATTLLSTSAPEYRVVSVEGAGSAIVDGRPLPLDHARELAHALRRGGHVVMPQGATLDLVAPGVLAVTLSGGSDATLPAIPAKGERKLECRVANGDLFFSTGRAFHGASLDVETPEATAHVTGTSLAVLRDAEGGTCVCVMEGRVQVTARGEEPYTVPAGSRLICPVEGGTEPARILHRSEHALHRLQDKTTKLLDR